MQNVYNMHSKKRFYQTACNRIYFPMMHSYKCFATLLHSCLLTKTAEFDYIETKTKQSIKRIESLTVGQIQATFYNLMTWSVIIIITTMLACTVSGRFQSL